MVEKNLIFLGVTITFNGWDQSPVDGNGMGWKLLCVVRGWDGMVWYGKLLVLGWYEMGNLWCWDGMVYGT